MDIFGTGAPISLACVKCARGKFRKGTDKDDGKECKNCLVGKYSLMGANRCVFAPVGHMVEENGEGYIPCSPGKYSSGGEECLPCESDGEFSASGASFCQKALVGTIPNVNRSGIEICPSCTFSVGGMNECNRCKEGLWSSPGSSTCSSCNPGEEFDATIADREMKPSLILKTNATNTRSNDNRVLSIVMIRTGERLASIHFRKYHNASKEMEHVIRLVADESYLVKIEGTSRRGLLDWVLVGEKGVVAVAHNVTTSLYNSNFTLPPGGGWCTACNAGTYSTNGGKCEPCSGVGLYSDAGASFCKTVPLGQRALFARNGTQLCPKNTFSLGGADNCTRCPDGFHSKKESASCSFCLAGEYYDEVATECEKCPAGKFASKGVLSAMGCKVCAIGTFSEAGSGFCSACPQHQQSAFIGSSECSCMPTFVKDSDHDDQCTCPPGSMLIGSQCEVCESAKYKSEFGINSCAHCDLLIEGSITVEINSTSASDCICPKGTFLGQDKTKCEKASAGVEEMEEGMTLQKLKLKRGSWRTFENSTDVRTCPVRDACLGGTKITEYCAEGHTGPYCNICKDGFSKDVFGLCHSCTSNAGDLLGTFGAVVFIVILCILGWLGWKRMGKTNTGKQKRKRFLTGLKILFVTWQIMAALPSIIPDIQLPASFKAFLRLFQFLNFNLFTIIPMGCLTSFNYYDTVIALTSTVIAACVILTFLAYFVVLSPTLKERLITVALGEAI